MKRLFFIFPLVVLFFPVMGHSSSDVTVTDSTISISNDYIKRTFAINDGFYTTSFFNRTTQQEYSSPESKEFLININDTDYNGKNFRFK